METTMVMQSFFKRDEDRATGEPHCHRCEASAFLLNDGRGKPLCGVPSVKASSGHKVILGLILALRTTRQMVAITMGRYKMNWMMLRKSWGLIKTGTGTLSGRGNDGSSITLSHGSVKTDKSQAHDKRAAMALSNSK